MENQHQLSILRRACEFRDAQWLMNRSQHFSLLDEPQCFDECARWTLSYTFENTVKKTKLVNGEKWVLIERKQVKQKNALCCKNDRLLMNFKEPKQDN